MYMECYGSFICELILLADYFPSLFENEKLNILKRQQAQANEVVKRLIDE